VAVILAQRLILMTRHALLGDYIMQTHTTFCSCLLLLMSFLYVGNQNGICWFEKGEGSQGFDCVPQVNMQHCVKD
jgi:hypothetical protein